MTGGKTGVVGFGASISLRTWPDNRLTDSRSVETSIFFPWRTYRSFALPSSRSWAPSVAVRVTFSALAWRNVPSLTSLPLTTLISLPATETSAGSTPPTRIVSFSQVMRAPSAVCTWILPSRTDRLVPEKPEGGPTGASYTTRGGGAGTVAWEVCGQLGARAGCAMVAGQLPELPAVGRLQAGSQ